jgi:putative restriction endonuclease
VTAQPLATRPAGAALRTLLEKAAGDSGFDLELPSGGDWLGFKSSHAPLSIWLAATNWDQPVAALSRFDVVNALTEHGAPASIALPADAAMVRAVRDVPALHAMLRRAYQLARTLPNEILHVFEQQTASIPRSTEAERLVVQRVGQDLFRERLLEYWQGRCAVTGLAVPELLRASHIKPWAACETDAERLDVFNGLLLAPNLDAAFDLGFLTVCDGGEVEVTAVLGDAERKLLGLGVPLHVAGLADGHRAYLAWHRERIFKG